MKYRRITTLVAVLSIGAVAVEPMRAADPDELTSAQKNQSVRNEIELSISRGLDWLKDQQKEGGHWSMPGQPAITALVLSAYMRAPSGEYRKDPPPYIKKGFRFLLDSVQPDGGIYREGLANYNTAISMTALTLSQNPEYAPVIEKARSFLVGMQAKDLATPSLNGGFGYGPEGSNRQHPDLSNTVMALEALYYSERMGTSEELKKGAELDWEAAIGFVSRTQNLPSHNPEEWASDDPENRGGFVYFPGHSMAGETELESGKTALRSYGSMSYAGLLSYIYADLKRDDPRVTAVMDWLKRNYTLTENPGMGNQGLFYYYQVMAKALAAYGGGELELADGREVDWRRELGLKLISMQNSDGSWVNPEGRWMENDPVLATAYSLLALEMVHWAM